MVATKETSYADEKVLPYALIHLSSLLSFSSPFLTRVFSSLSLVSSLRNFFQRNEPTASRSTTSADLQDPSLWALGEERERGRGRVVVKEHAPEY